MRRAVFPDPVAPVTMVSPGGKTKEMLLSSKTRASTGSSSTTTRRASVDGLTSAFFLALSLALSLSLFPAFHWNEASMNPIFPSVESAGTGFEEVFSEETNVGTSSSLR